MEIAKENGYEWWSKLVETIQDYDDFTAEKDPSGEHSRGCFDYDDLHIWWHIGYYRRDRDGNPLKKGEYDSSNPEECGRILTIATHLESMPKSVY